MVIKKSAPYYIKRIFFYLLIGILAFVCVIPLYWMVRSSFMKNTDIYVMDPFVFWPKKMLWSNYVDAWKSALFTRYAINTIVIAVLNIFGTLLTASMAAYAFSRIKWKGRGFCFAMILTTMMLPGAVTIVPQFLIWRNIHMVDTYVPLIVPAFLGGGAFNIFLLRQFFLAIPNDLDEAAEIDGAGKLRIFLQVILPLSKSAMIVVALFTFLGNWNDFFGPIIYLNTKEKFTLAVGLLQFHGDYATKWNLLMAASTIVVTPCILIYLIGQRYLIEGISLTGMKA
ncbi:carbohydrate ABC transporter permease [Anaerocolumna sp. AGMB13025]|uniref:carbohydrate ABC transporter permease n=1 Tax=Anaerocolumna sp. AGMB13025 TaxID=3039116 RepID=UPI00241FC832|nr:carbohydrate ABC transporter permease [Anaerocolumna sp. AGMB13025]WFR59125.1 carbohydrate ABC transporter permease [Anaerocolumna sp. AGMB13025]